MRKVQLRQKTLVLRVSFTLKTWATHKFSMRKISTQKFSTRKISTQKISTCLRIKLCVELPNRKNKRKRMRWREDMFDHKTIYQIKSLNLSLSSIIGPMYWKQNEMFDQYPYVISQTNYCHHKPKSTNHP